VPINAFLNINEGLQGDKGIVDEDGDIVVPFVGEILTA
jgi:protein involved in polysaccharide export with SLBB domain